VPSSTRRRASSRVVARLCRPTPRSRDARKPIETSRSSSPPAPRHRSVRHSGRGFMPRVYRSRAFARRETFVSHCVGSEAHVVCAARARASPSHPSVAAPRDARARRVGSGGRRRAAMDDDVARGARGRRARGSRSTRATRR
jgi:hypothetical protein